MLKGVNRQVLEVNKPESRYFERILFVVKPEFTSLSGAKLLKDAKEQVAHREAQPPKMRRAAVRQRLLLAVAAAIGAAISAAILVPVLR